MALELGAYNIRANAIAPGLFKSEITSGLMQKDWLNTVAQRTCPMRTFGTSDPALTSLVRYLIHDSSRYISGNIFIVDAGATLPGVPIFSSLWVSSAVLVFLGYSSCNTQYISEFCLWYSPRILIWKVMVHPGTPP